MFRGRGNRVRLCSLLWFPRRLWFKMWCPLRAHLWLAAEDGIRVSRVVQLATDLFNALSMRKSVLMILRVSCAAPLVIPQGFVLRIAGGERTFLIWVPHILRYLIRVRVISCYAIARFLLGTTRAWLCRMLGESLPRVLVLKAE